MIHRVVILFFLLLVLACSERPRVAQAPPPGPPMMTLRGTVHEGYSGDVIRDGNMVLADFYKDIHTTGVDGEGRFRFEVPATSQFLFLKWKAPNDMRGWSVSATPRDGHAKVPQDGKTQDVDYGVVKVWLTKRAEERFAAGCRGNGLGDARSTFGILPMIRQKDSFKYWDYGEAALSSAWPDGWNGLLCVTETAKKAGSYFPGVDGYDVTWQIRLVRHPDGRVLTKTLRTSAPEKADIVASGSRITTDPMPLLAEWLKSIRAAARPPDSAAPPAPTG